MRRRYLSCYDIRNPKRLRQVHKLMQGYGYALQYSVFICDLTGMECVRMKSQAAAIMNLDVDSLVVIDLGATNLDRFDYVGARHIEPPDPGSLVI
ncbi:MAG: CRISPR-associated endonuclease Cas2 [Nocardioidaceae bacterium]